MLMKTDKLFYALFQQSPTVALTLLPDLPIDAVYDFSAPVVKESEFRLDGLLTPEDPDLPLIFIEVQMFPDPGFYVRYVSEVFLYLRHFAPARGWRGLLFLKQRSMNLGSEQISPALFETQVTKVYLDELRAQSDLSAEWLLLLLIAAEPEEVGELGRKVLAAPARHLEPTQLLGLVETIVVDRMPTLSPEEIQAMLGLVTEELKQTRFAQDLMAEGRQEGRQGEALTFALRLLNRRFGELDSMQLDRCRNLTVDQLESLGEALFDFNSVGELEAWLDRLG